ncbi:MAG: energy transducer TonB [Gemmatimonadota bacterium]|jgi:hypothetical protein
MSPCLRTVAAVPLLLMAVGCAHDPAPAPGNGPDPRAVVYQPGEVDKAPELIQCGDWIDHGEVRITYAVVQFVVSATGEVRNPRVIEAPPRMPELGLEAMRIARTCQYRAAMRGGKPVAVRWSKRFDFVME